MAQNALEPLLRRKKALRGKMGLWLKHFSKQACARLHHKMCCTHESPCFCCDRWRVISSTEQWQRGHLRKLHRRERRRGVCKQALRRATARCLRSNARDLLLGSCVSGLNFVEQQQESPV